MVEQWINNWLRAKLNDPLFLNLWGERERQRERPTASMCIRLNNPVKGYFTG